MDASLVAWARAVKARGAWRGPRPPPLWLFTDEVRLPDPLPAVRRLPKGLCGVVFRDDHVPERPQRAAAIARICRERRLALVVSGGPALAYQLRAGRHLRGGRGRARLHPCCVPATASAHGVAQAVRARRAGATVLFVSPAFPTSSHAAATSLGPLRWAAIVRRSKGFGAALGGIDGRSVRRLPPKLCQAVGAIAALSD